MVYVIQSRQLETQVFLYIIVRAFFIFSCYIQHLRQIPSKASVLDFAVSKLWSVISNFRKIDLVADISLAFSQILFQLYMCRTSLLV